MTKVNILFSGRDAFPRVIVESGACGCFNIALNTISDAKFYYDGELGTLVGSDEVSIEILRSRSMAYISNDIIWDKMYNLMIQTYDYKTISLKNRMKYNINMFMEKISKFIE
jgi:hypothetical protein